MVQWRIGRTVVPARVLLKARFVIAVAADLVASHRLDLCVAFISTAGFASVEEKLFVALVKELSHSQLVLGILWIPRRFDIVPFGIYQREVGGEKSQQKGAHVTDHDLG